MDIEERITQVLQKIIEMDGLVSGNFLNELREDLADNELWEELITRSPDYEDIFGLMFTHGTGPGSREIWTQDNPEDGFHRLYGISV